MSAPNSQKATIPSYQDIAQATFGTLWPEATPQDWALVVHKLREALRAKSNGPSDRDAVLDEIEEFLEGQQDVRDGPDGEQLPNRAMSLLSALQAARQSAGADDGQLSRQDKFTMVHNLLNRVDSLLAEARFAQDSSVRHQLKIAKSILRDAEHG